MNDQMQDPPAAVGANDRDRETVRRGAALMDDFKPGWWKHVNPATLDLSSPCMCVVGQNGLRYEAFMSLVDEEFETAFFDPSLEGLWVAEIRERMESSAVAEADRVLAVALAGLREMTEGQTARGDGLLLQEAFAVTG